MSGEEEGIHIFIYLYIMRHYIVYFLFSIYLHSLLLLLESRFISLHIFHFTLHFPLTL